MKRNGMASHERPNNGEYDTWLTPPSILSVLGEFDMDPCAAPSPRPWPTAKRHVELPEDGLSVEWGGRVWLNPPYGERIGDWLEAMSHHRSGIALTFARTETEAWQRWVWPFAKAVLFIAGRLSFYYPDGTRAGQNSGAPSALIAYTKTDAEILRSSGIRGVLVKPEAPCSAD